MAYHEMGHALVAMALPGSDPVHKISIIPRGIGALGYTIQRPTEDRFLMTREELENKMAVLLGGRAAEHIVFGHLSTGAADDLVEGHRHRAQHGHALRHGREARPRLLRGRAAAVPAEAIPVRGAHVQRRDRARDRLRRARDCQEGVRPRGAHPHRNRRVLEEGARQLLQKETLSEAEIATCVAGSSLGA